ncbi:hypothetical protein [Bradyrhizobium sp. 2TAF24]|uniref:hypothetical protein n=1 Tax=Bradyrhizobium sp. 2TAF24 TaxID=3233011 RepID=UPI003F936E4E
MTRLIACLIASALICSPHPALSAGASGGSGLRGKHLVLSWSDNRVEKIIASGEEHPINQRSVVTVYVSAEGRFFSQFGRSAGRGIIDHKEVSGDRNMLHWRNEGAALIADQTFVRGVRRLIVTFDAGYSSCTLRVLHGKEAGSSNITYLTMDRKVPVEVATITVTSTSCSIATGNPFA